MIKLLKRLTVYKWAVLAVLVLVFAQSMSDLYLPTLPAIPRISGKLVPSCSG